MDSKQEEIGELEIFLKSKLTPPQRYLIKRKLKAMRSGIYGEKDAAYYIDFYFGNSKNWAVIHDLRLEHKGQVAQIDHLLINRFFDMYVLESKNYSSKLKISPGGELQVYNGKEYSGIPSPIEQNKRHIHLLDLFPKSNNILPKRMRISIRQRFKNIILVSPKPIITRPPEEKFDTRESLKMILKNDYEVFLAKNVEEAFSQIKEHSPDVILLDIILPDLDGLKVLERIKQDDPNIIVIMVTATKPVKTAPEAKKLGAYGCVTKPFDIDELRLIITRSLSA